MKPFLFFLLFLLIPKMSFSQALQNNELIISADDKLVYLDSIDIETQSKNYKYLRIIKDYKLDKEIYTVLEYYKSGVLKMTGTSKTKEGYTKEGLLTHYYENGNKKSLTNYVKGRVNGVDLEWYENGTKKLEGENIEDEKKKTSQLKINQFWDLNGVQKVVDGNGFFEDKDENESSKGEIKNGFKEGVWEGSFLKLKYPYKESYTNGKLISGESVDENNISHKYTEVEKRPEYKKGVEGFYQYIGKNYKMPDMPRGTKGKVYITFVVDKDGKIVEPKVLRDIGYGTGEEAIRVLIKCENWTPGEQRGQKVRCTYSLPITLQSPN